MEKVTQPTYYKQLDGLRAIAVISVMIAHWLQNAISIPLLRNLPYGTGVTLFFVLSGFLITKILLDFKEKNIALGKSNFNSVKSFYVRRSLRIFPIYYLTIFVLLIIGFDNTAELFPWLVSYTSNIYMTFSGEYVGSFTHFWSLAVEEQFYLLWVFVIIFIPKAYLKKTIIYVIAISILLLYYFIFYTPYWMANALMICSMHILGLGALIAFYVKYEPERVAKMNLSRVKLLLFILSLFFILIYVYQKPDTLYNSLKDFKNPFISFIYALVVLVAIRDGFTGVMKLILENKVMIYIGRISYGLYIYHLFMNPLYFKFLSRYIYIRTDDYGYFLVFFLLNMIIASASWYFIEQPINNLKKYFKY